MPSTSATTNTCERGCKVGRQFRSLKIVTNSQKKVQSSPMASLRTIQIQLEQLVLFESFEMKILPLKTGYQSGGEALSVTQNLNSNLSRQRLEATYPSGKSSHLFVFLRKTFQAIYVS